MDQDNNNKTADGQTTQPPVSGTIPVTPQPISSTPPVTTTPAVSPEATNPLASAPAITEKVEPVNLMGTTPTPPESLQTPPPVTPPVQTPGSPQDPGYAQTKSHNMMFIVVGIIVLIIISLVVLFFFRQFTSMTSQGADTTPSPQAMTSPTKPPVSPTVTPANAEEEELQQIELGEIEEELTNIERDITQL